MSKYVWEAKDITQEVNMRDQVRRGERTFLVKGTIDFEVEVSEVADKDEAKRIVETMEGKVSPWASGHTDVFEFEVDIDTDEIEESDADV